MCHVITPKGGSSVHRYSILRMVSITHHSQHVLTWCIQCICMCLMYNTMTLVYIICAILDLADVGLSLEWFLCRSHFEIMLHIWELFYLD